MLKLDVLMLTCLICITSCADRNTDRQELSESLSAILSETVRDSLTSFIEGTKELLTENDAKAIYTIELSIHQNDTIISFWAGTSTLDESFPFHDSRFILEIAKENDLILMYDWMNLYLSLVEDDGSFSRYGVKGLNNDILLAYISRNFSEVEDILSLNDFDQITYERGVDIHHDDRQPIVKIYRYSHQIGLELLCQQDIKGLPYLVKCKK